MTGMEEENALSPAQRRAADSVAAALRTHPVVQLAAADAREGLRPGSGCSAVLRRLAETHPDGAFIGAPEVVARGARGPHDAFALAKELWEGGADLVVVDDVDILSGSTTIYSNRFSSQGESHGFNKTSAEPTILVKALTDYAVARGKRLVFRSVEDHFARFAGVAFPVVLPVFRAEDYEFFFSRWLAQSAPVAADFDYGEVFKAFPSLTPAEIRVACVPAAGSPGAEWTTAAVLANVEERLGGAHGAVQLSKVEKIDLARMPGLDKAMEILEQQVVHPFESTADDGAEPKAGVLLYGPPGTGKTSIGRALAHRMPGRLFTVKEMFLYKELVETFARAEACAPSVIFFDDIDVLLHRSKVAWGGGGIFRFLLSKMDGMSSYRAANGKSVTIIMTCESPKTLPDALIRSGRIELWVKLEYPGNRKRLAILEKLCAEERLDAMRGITGKELKYVADRTEDFSPADLRRVVKDTTNALSYRKAKGKKDKQAGDLLETSVENLRRMRDEVESFMKQLYQ